MAKKKKTESERKLEAAFHEVGKDEPSIVGKTRRKYGAERAEAQRRAIAFSKAREAGARIPRKGFREGGAVEKSGTYYLHAGETVVASSDAKQSHGDARGWRGRGYDMGLPTTDRAGAKIAKVMKARIRMR